MAPPPPARPAVVRLRRGRLLAVAGVDAPRTPPLRGGLQLPTTGLPGRSLPDLQPPRRRHRRRAPARDGWVAGGTACSLPDRPGPGRHLDGPAGDEIGRAH